MRGMKRLLNRSEEDTLKELNLVTSRYGLQVHTKVRMADVCPIEGRGIPDDLYKYALMAHFDFLVTNEEYIPQFAVEFDGSSHETPTAKIRDAKKDAICRTFKFPLLRVKINYLPKIYNSLSLIEWIIDVYYMEQAFYEAQEKGQVPYDEPFDPFFIYSTGTDGDKKRFPYWISRDAILAIRKFHSQGKIALPGTSGFIGEDSDGKMRGIEFLPVNDTHGILVKLSMQSQLFPGSFTDLLGELLVIFAYEKIQEYLIFGSGLIPLTVIDRVAKLYQTEFKMLRAHATGFRPPPR
jgi:hypothetical protein